MTKIKFLQFYQTLDKSGIKDFKKFSASQYYNRGRDFSAMLSGIDKLTDKFNGSTLNSKEFITSLSNTLDLNTRTIWNRLHELMKIAEYYIALKSIEQNKLLFDNTAASYYLDKQSYNLFQQKYKANLNTFRKTKKGPESFYQYYEVLQKGGYYNIFNNQGEQYLKNLTEQVVYHTASYMINHYLHLTEMLQLGSISAKELTQSGLSFLSDNIIENFLNTIKNDYKELYAIVSFHYYIYKAFLNKNEDEHYRSAIEYFNEVYDVISGNYKTMMYQILINYCIDRTNINDRQYYKDLFGLYNRKLNDGLFQDLQVGNFPINNFRDYIFVALQLEKLDWIKWFIEKYSKELPQKVRDDEINLSWGIVYYHEQDYAKALEYLNRVAGDNYIHYSDSKYYKMRLYYETEDFENALMEIDNYKHYHRTHKEIPDTFKRNYKFFLNDFTRLMNVKLKGGREDAELLKHDLINKAQSPRRMWVIRKLDEML